MADNINANGTINYQIDGINLNGNTSLLYFVTSSTMLVNVQTLPTGSWIPLATTSSISDIRYTFVSNQGSGSVNVATDSAGTKVAAILQTGDWTFLPNSGSGYIYAKVFGTASLVTSIVAAA